MAFLAIASVCNRLPRLASNTRCSAAVNAAHLTTEKASLTHAHCDSVSACVLWSLVIQEAITGGGSDESVDWEGPQSATALSICLRNSVTDGVN